MPVYKIPYIICLYIPSKKICVPQRAAGMANLQPEFPNFEAAILKINKNEIALLKFPQFENKYQYGAL